MEAPPAKAQRVGENESASSPSSQRAAHGELLPGALVRKIPNEDAEVLRCLLRFLESEGLGSVALYINGGYIRDLLLGKIPDDLDISLCLRDCPEAVTVAALLEKLPSFVTSRGDLGIVEVKIATILSDESKDKKVDTFKAHFVNTCGRKIEVDVMPTIGEEVYEEGTRIPVRDQRGTPEQDALRRDLTIGAMLMQVSFTESSTTGDLPSLSYTLWDFFGGLGDLDERVLRAPFPKGLNLQLVREIVLQTEADRKLAETLQLSVLGEVAEVQVLWWVKILRDDPLRICRALRLSSKLRFSLHDSFWKAAPFAMQELRTKVAGSRKDTEYQKIGGYGFQACVDFFELAFTKQFGPDASMRLAAALFGGQDAKGKAKTMSDVKAFDIELFRSLSSTLSPVDSPPFRMGSMLAAAAFCTDFSGGTPPLQEFQAACEGMCTSNLMREAGQTPLQTSIKLAGEVPIPGRLECGIASACGISPEQVCLHILVWDAKQLHAGAKDWTPNLRDATFNLALGMLKRSALERWHLIEGPLTVLARNRPIVKGGVLNTPGVLEVPHFLRKQVLQLLEVGLRLLSWYDPVDDGEQLKRLLDAKPELQKAISASVWYEDDGKTLREEFQPAKKGKAAQKKS